VLEGGSAIDVASWIDQVPALVMAWYPGQEGGHAIADVLLGDVNPSGKLPVTFAVSDAQLPPFIHDQDAVTYDYFHGYRYLDKNGDAPSFPFGFGLSYTSFSYTNLHLASAQVAKDGTVEASVDVTNTGSREGKETVELYVSYEGSQVERAVRDLEGFSKVDLQPGETKTVTIDVPVRQLAYWDVTTNGWVVEPIHYTVAVGGSSRDLPLSTGFDVTP
jgi:beta-glucosidase